MSGFSLISDPSATVFRVFTISSQAFTIGDLVDMSRSAATVTPSTSSSTPYTIHGVAMETVASTATSLLCALVNDRQLWKVPSTNNANSAHNGQRMVLTDKSTINNTGTDSTTANAVFEQWGYTGATTDKVLIGRLLAVANVTA